MTDATRLDDAPIREFLLPAFSKAEIERESRRRLNARLSLSISLSVGAFNSIVSNYATYTLIKAFSTLVSFTIG
jgi:hypothetical protein